ncbi:hypothetical protein [Pseudonocardia sp.]|uniref:hypothetical protein n=1 Tax=Pseudonocardia sp. TaxID=60912 RepID=UPI003D10B839
MLGVKPVRSERPPNGFLPPSLRLEVAYQPGRPITWRLSVVGRRLALTSTPDDGQSSGAQTTSGTDFPEEFADEDGRPLDGELVAVRGKFIAEHVTSVYLLCGDGHYFMEEDLSPGGEDLSQWRQHAFVAALGPVASGKSYLLVRALKQPLKPQGIDHPNSGSMVHVAGVKQFPFEVVPLDTLEEHYLRTFHANTPIPITVKDDMVPATILKEKIGPEVRAAAEALQLKVMGYPRASQWGDTLRQPIFLRTRIDGRPVLSCIVDLPGELFDRENDNYVGFKALPMMQHCTEVVWVIDPFSSGGRFTDYLRAAVTDSDEFARIVEGSARPDERRAGDLKRLHDDLANRDGVNDRLGSDFALDFGHFCSPLGGTLYNLIAITKCDLVERALRNCRLDQLGAKGDVAEGIARYIGYVIDRNYPVLAADDVQELVDYLQVGAFDGPARDAAQRSRVEQLATSLLEHYSKPEQFWNLVHGGAADHIELTNPDLVAALDELEVSVPSLDAHVAACHQPDGGSLLQMRDLVMSALGCGLMQGLGQRARVVSLLAQRWRDVRFFLCSPLGTVPSYKSEAGGVRMPPSGDRKYPKVDEPSAGLTQLQLRIMRRALP